LKKIVWLEDDVHKQLTLFKVNHSCKTLGDAVERLLKNLCIHCQTRPAHLAWRCCYNKECVDKELEEYQKLHEESTIKKPAELDTSDLYG